MTDYPSGRAAVPGPHSPGVGVKPTKTSISACVAVATMLLASCGGNAGRGAPALTTSSSAPGSAQPLSSPTVTMPMPTMTKTMDQVLDDIEYAAQGLGRPRLRATKGREDCEAHGVIFTAEVPGTTELPRLADRLQQRAWRTLGGLSTTGALSSGPWIVAFGARRVPAEFQSEAGSDTGVFMVSVVGQCRDL